MNVIVSLFFVININSIYFCVFFWQGFWKTVTNKIKRYEN